MTTTADGANPADLAAARVAPPRSTATNVALVNDSGRARHLTPVSPNGEGGDEHSEGAVAERAHAELAGLELGEIAERAGLRRIDALAWRDYDDPEAGGSELHAHRIFAAWADAGLDVAMTTSAVPVGATVVRRDGYRVVRRSGRYGLFPRTILSGALGRIGSGDGLVEIWNGMPFFSPAWCRAPRIVFLHHVHAEMWHMVLPRHLARIGHAIEHHVAPPFYRQARIVTLSHSSKAEIVDRLALAPEHITVVPPGVEPHFSPGGEKAPHPLVVAVGRLVPVKRFDLLVDALVRLRSRHPDLKAVIVGEGYERPALEALVAARGAGEWLSLPGYLADDDLVALYRRAWVVTSASQREGWGMTVTEAGACGTPAVVTRIGGHEDAVIDGRSGLLADTMDDLVAGLDAVLGDEVLRRRLTTGAVERAASLTWEETARGALAALAAEALARR